MEKHKQAESNTTVLIIEKVLDRIGPLGCLTVLWTLVFCVAIYSQNKESLNQIWDCLYLTWIVIVAFWILWTILLAVIVSIKLYSNVLSNALMPTVSDTEEETISIK